MDSESGMMSMEGGIPSTAPMEASPAGGAGKEPEVEVSGEEKTKKFKISKAQQYMFFAVLGASIVAGVTVVVSGFLLNYINFNIRVITAKDEAIESYSRVVEKTGACVKPRGSVYSVGELEKCDPNKVEAEQVVGTLRYKVLDEMTANVNLESVARESASICYDKEGALYSYTYLREKYEDAEDRETKEYYLGLMKMCSSLRVIPDALPSVKNETSMMSSVGQIFKISNTQQDSLAPGSGGGTSKIPGLNVMTVGLSITNEANMTRTVLSNFEKSIRNFDISTATIQWNGNRLTVGAQMNAYYTDTTGIKEKTVKIDPEDKKK